MRTAFGRFDQFDPRPLNGRNQRILLKKSASSRKLRNSANIVSFERLSMVRFYYKFDFHESIFPGGT